MAAPKVLAIVLAGGEGKRLMPLTRDRAKPAVPFGGSYRLVDFALSNLVNAGYLKICVLTQYKSDSLDKHISLTWRMSPILGNYVATVPAQQRLGKQWYLGSADALLQSMNLMTDERPDVVVVFGADHVYRMDPSAMVAAHIESGAGVSVAGIRVPREEATQFGVIKTFDGVMIDDFLEKPADPPGLPDSPDEAYASMGNYVFSADALFDALRRDADDPDSHHDVGGDIIPMVVSRRDAAVYDFTRNIVPGALDWDTDYWRDVGTIGSYHEANLDLVSVEPTFNLYNNDWPIFTFHPQLPGAKFVRSAHAEDAVVGAGSIISGASAHSSVLGTNVKAETGADINRSVVMDNVRIGRGAHVENAILDKNIEVPPGFEIGLDHEADRAAGFYVSDEGITVLGKGQPIEPR